MGYRGTWAAFADIDKDEVHRRLALAETGRTDDYPLGDISGIQVSPEWYVVLVEFLPHPIYEEKFLAKLSQNCRVVGFNVEEHVMASGASMHANGRTLWSVTHESEKGSLNLNLRGAPPSQFEEIRSRIFQTQNADGGEDSDVDYIIELPAELAFSVCGYRWDQPKPYGDARFNELKASGASPPEKPSLLGLLGFGRKKT